MHCKLVFNPKKVYYTYQGKGMRNIEPIFENTIKLKV